MNFKDFAELITQDTSSSHNKALNKLQELYSLKKDISNLQSELRKKEEELVKFKKELVNFNVEGL